jgi:hypothetical protein
MTKPGSLTIPDVTRELVEQLEFHWKTHLRPKLDGLTDEEYFWEPVAGCWNIRPRADASAPPANYVGSHVADYAFPEPDPAPVTTIAWRLAHVIVGVFGARNAAHFGGPPIDYENHLYAADAASALAQLDEGYKRWVTGVRSLGDRLTTPVGPAEGPYADRSYLTLILHIHREVIHHGAEMLLLRDLYRSR